MGNLNFDDLVGKIVKEAEYYDLPKSVQEKVDTFVRAAATLCDLENEVWAAFDELDEADSGTSQEEAEEAYDRHLHNEPGC